MSRVIVGDFMDFIRINLCIYGIFFGLLGHLLFNNISTSIIWICASCFFLVAGVYSYNNITDKKEDSVNRRKINKYSKSKKGIFAASLFIFLGVLFAYMISEFSFVLSMLFIFLGISYSLFRMKSLILIKNMFTSLLISILFLIGINHYDPTLQFFLYYSLFFLFVLLGSIISDVRDIEGDKKAGLKTLPALFGQTTTKIIISVGILSSFIIILCLDSWYVYVLIPFLLISLLYTYRNNPSKAHSIQNVSVIVLVALLFIVSIY